MTTPATPLVTVIIPSYNHERWVEAAINSVLDQTYAPVELIVIDDGSTDTSIARIEALREKHGFEFRCQKNKGLLPTLNETLQRCRGEFIVPFASDDVMRPERLAVQVAWMQQHPESGICGGNVVRINAEGSSLGKRDRMKPARRMDFAAVLAEGAPPAPTLMYRRAAIDKVGGFHVGVKCEDLYMNLKIAEAGYVIDMLADVLAEYRIHGSNSHARGRIMVEDVLKIYAMFEMHPGVNAERVRYLTSMFVKYAERDKTFARELLAQLSWRDVSMKVIKGLLRLWFAKART